MNTASSTNFFNVVGLISFVSKQCFCVQSNLTMRFEVRNFNFSLPSSGINITGNLERWLVDALTLYSHSCDVVEIRTAIHVRSCAGLRNWCHLFQRIRSGLLTHKSICKETEIVVEP